MRGSKRLATYSAARGAQLAFVQAVGVELAPDNIQVNAVAQNFVENPIYYSEVGGTVGVGFRRTHGSKSAPPDQRVTG